MDLFLYGTLCHQPLRDVVLGGASAMTRPARLAGHAVYWGKGQSYPVLLAETDAVAEGLLLHLPEAAVAARIDYYEGGFGYALKPVTVETDDGPAAAQVYMPEHAGPEPGAPWSLADWAEKWGELSVLAAEEAMGEFGRLTPDALARAFPMMRVRAASRLRAARTLRPATLRADTAREGVELEVHRRPYSAFFAVEEHDIRFPRFDGSMSETVNRAAFVMGDVITVLPYDPVRDAVLLVEQFRFAVYVRGDRRPWSLEPIAGRIDPGETPEEAARREALEEAGLSLTHLETIGSYYASPAAVTEYLFSYLALCDLPEHASGVGGLPEEHEDIRSHVVSFDRAMELAATGEIENAPLLVSLFWLGLNRPRLRRAG